jgi:hypothetical protein
MPGGDLELFTSQRITTVAGFAVYERQLVHRHGMIQSFGMV